MRQVQEVDLVSPGIYVWQAYDGEIKADLYSAALETPAGLYLVDPIPLAPAGLLRLQAEAKAAGIFVTNVNHLRAAMAFAKALSVSIYVHETLRGNRDFSQTRFVQDGEMFSRGLTAVEINGGPTGEIGLHYDGNGGTMIVGDALINFEPYGFGLLPSKYCNNANLMRQSLRKLLDYRFERMLFAHGTPILSDAHARLKQLLAIH